MTEKTKLNVQSFPRPPRLEKTSRHLRITYKDVEIADTHDAYWMLETHHPPSASSNRLSFYAGPWDCFVDGERVDPQPGDFYGGWVTSEIEGIVKGRTGNLDPVV
ncbi:hypothetical protein A9Z42_0053780 [Trichoderma parareesei]|uniref:DUF427 domain-containing protein n=1 Tax=Trichoderma parareesei TaxID=858221 RepID=A0A2H2ZVV7_TRIPA|nr:hypothetical protein A9Z42_0053780 [Trichoderma parareesei]